MLDFFRRYQWYFFLVITIVIVISFSFFGTYNTLSSNSWGEQVAFKAINGKDVTRFEVDDMTNFLATDSDDKTLYGGAWGLNFLNDGVIRKDFLQTGLALELESFYQKDLQGDLQKRLAKEKKFKLYEHPQAPFVSMENAWNYFMPQMTAYLGTLKNAQDASHPDAFQARVKLYLTERQLPSSTLRQVLRYQERQHEWLTPDPDLNRIDLSLFGYHSMEDWFGPRFVRLVSQFIINSSILAEAKGYDVPRAEVLADLVRNTEISFQQNKNNPNMAVATPEEYFNEQLRRLNMDQTRAIRVWRQVMLFRRYFQDVGNAALVDSVNSQKFYDFAKQDATLDVYKLPAELRINDYASLQNFEVYLNAIAKPSKANLLDLPTQFFTVEEVLKRSPELVQKRYVLEIAQASKKNLQSRVGIREMWNWEAEPQNWAALKKQFPDLGIKKDSTREERLEALDALDAVTRGRVDTFAKISIIDAHPDWMEVALQSAQPHIQIVGLRPQGGKTPFEGLDNKQKREELIRLLDEAPVGEQGNSALKSFTADQQNFYRIRVVERDARPDILTFAEASADGTLVALRDRLLEKHYLTIREQKPSLYQKEDKTWKSLNEVHDQVADRYFDQTIKALQSVQKSVVKQDKDVVQPDADSTRGKDLLASLRLYGYVQETKNKIEKNPSESAQLTRSKEATPKDHLLERQPLVNQWRLEKEEYVAERGGKDPLIDATEAFALPEQSWSTVKASPNGDLAFYQVKGKGMNEKKAVAVAEQTSKAHALLSAEAQRVLMRHVLQQIAAKGAISLAYLSTPSEEETPPPALTEELIP